MAAKRSTAAATSAPHVIVPTAVYTRQQAREALGLARTTISREIKLGRLRVAKRAGHYLILGEDLLAWLQAGRCSRGGTDAVEGMPSPPNGKEAKDG